jgi:hypothetical protein
MNAENKPVSNAEARRVARLTGEVTLETPTPFAAVVRTNRSKKAAKGTPVTVAKIFKGDWGPCAICHTEDGDKIFLSLGNLTHKGKANAKVVKALEEEDAARRFHGDRRVKVGEPDWWNEKCVAFDVFPTLRDGRVHRVRLFFPRQTKDGNPLFDNGTVPGWLWDAKLREARIPADFVIVAE